MRLSLQRQKHTIDRLHHPVSYLPPRRAILDLLLALLVGCGIGVIVIVSTHFIENWKLVAGLVGGPAFIIMTLRWPEYGLLALVALTNGLINTNWMPLLGFGPASVHIQEIMLGVLIGLLVMRSSIWQDYRLRNSPLSIPILIFLIVIVLSMLNSFFALGGSIKTLVQRGRNLMLWSMFFPVVHLLRDRAMLGRFITGLWIITGLLAFGVMLRIVYPGLHPIIFPVEIEQLRTAGTQFSGVGRVFQYRGGPMLYAMLPVLVATLAFTPRSQMSTFRYLALTLLLGLVVNWLFRSFQRSMWVSSALVLILLFLIMTSRDRMRLIHRLFPIGVMMLIAIVAYWRIFPNETEQLWEASFGRIASLTSGANLARTDDSVDWRIIETDYALRSIRENPLLGIGPGSEYRPPLEREILWNEYGLRWYIHNAYLWITVLLGFAGLLPFLALSALYVLRTVYFWRFIDDPFFRAVYLGLGLSFFGQLISNNTQPTFFDGPGQSIYPTIVGVSEAILYLSRQERTAL